MTTRRSTYDQHIHKTHPATLAQLLSMDVKLLPWSHDDLKAILRHQLKVPMALELGDLLPAVPTTAKTFGDLLASANPSLPHLKAAKEFFKETRIEGDHPLPPEVATALYFGTILAARLRCGVSISKLRTQKLIEAVDWGLAHSWVVEPLATLFRESKALLKHRATGA
jgi:hypothetical protein